MNGFAARRGTRARLVTPFALVALLPLLMAPAPPGGGEWLNAAYAVLTLGVFLSIVLVP